mgnify:CR=1 FL=1
MSESFAAYMPHIRERRRQERAAWEMRRERAWESARRIAACLRGEFGATRVLVFGSLARQGRFDQWSDIDIAVSGIAARDFYAAVARALGLSEFQLDVVDLEDCAASLREIISREGVAI